MQSILWKNIICQVGITKEITPKGNYVTKFKSIIISPFLPTPKGMGKLKQAKRPFYHLRKKVRGF